MIRVAIGIGSNIDPEFNISQAKKMLRSLYPSIVFSPLFQCESIGFEGDDFINLVAYFDVRDLDQQDHSLHQQLVYLSSQLKGIEKKLGYHGNQEKFSSRRIDIDILLFGDYCLERPMQLPRREILQNAYVLRPLSELLPDTCHPEKGQTFRQLWQNFDSKKQRVKSLESSRLTTA